MPKTQTAVRLNDEEVSALDALAQDEKLSRSEIMRRLIRRAYAALLKRLQAQAEKTGEIK